MEMKCAERYLKMHPQTILKVLAYNIGLNIGQILSKPRQNIAY